MKEGLEDSLETKLMEVIFLSRFCINLFEFFV
jgi:hypothetical protein